MTRNKGTKKKTNLLYHFKVAKKLGSVDEEWILKCKFKSVVLYTMNLNIKLEKLTWFDWKSGN